MALAPPGSRSAVFYSYDVLMGGKKVGTLQRFNPSSERDLQRVRQIAASATDTVEIVPGRTDRQITIDRFETYPNALIQAMGYVFQDIGEITVPINIVEKLFKPGVAKTEQRTITYANCWPKSWSKTVQEGTVLITESMTVWVTAIIVGGITDPESPDPSGSSVTGS